MAKNVKHFREPIGFDQRYATQRNEIELVSGYTYLTVNFSSKGLFD